MGVKSALAGLTGSVLLAVSAAAQPPAPAPAVSEQTVRAGDDLGRLGMPVLGLILGRREELGLSDPQVEALERLGADFLRETIRRQADLLVAGVDLESLLGADPSKAIDLANAEAKLRELERIRTDLQIALLRVIEAAKAQLTPDQRAKLATLMAGGPQSAADPPAPAGRAAGPPPPGGPGRPAPGPGAPRAPGHPAPPPWRGFEPHRPTVHGRVFIGGWPRYWWEPSWGYPAPPAIVQPPAAYTPPPAYWYYCASAQAYYPYVSSCPEAWVVVPTPPG
jgi:hypothetical protein